MEMPLMPKLPMLDKKGQTDSRISSNNNIVAEPRTPFKLSQLDLGSIAMGTTGKKSDAKRAAAAALDDDEDPREEAQMIQLLQQMQKVKQSKENKRRKGEIAAKAKVVAAGVRRNVSKRVEEVRAGQDKLATELRSTVEALRAALEEEANLASALLKEQQKAMEKAVNYINEKYDEAAKVQAQAKVLGDCMRQHCQVVRSHIATQVDSKMTETEEVVQVIHNQPDKTLSLISSMAGLA